MDTRSYSRDELLDCTQAIETLLRTYRVQFWLEFFVAINEEIRRFWRPDSTSVSKRAILGKIRGIFGGMGAFNDLRLDTRAGEGLEQRLTIDQTHAFNLELDRLRQRLFELVQGLERQLDRESEQSES